MIFIHIFAVKYKKFTIIILKHVYGDDILK